MTLLKEPATVVAGSSRIRRGLVGLLTVILAAIVIGGIIAGPEQPGDRIESLTAIIKCPQCQGESIKDSSALTARTMRTMVAEQVADGRTDDEILDSFRALYGEQAILDPGLTASTLALWGIPALALAGGIGALVYLIKARQP